MEFCEFLGYEQKPATLFQDYQSAIKIYGRGYTNSEQSRHIDIKYYFMKDLIDRGKAVVMYLPTAQMTADILTKPLQGTLFRELRAMLLGLDINDV
jgi:hypothetical protein